MNPISRTASAASDYPFAMAERFPGAEIFVPKRVDVSLSTLHQAADRCRGCDLFKHATQAVFGDGPTTARLMLIGEQPGDEEDKQGKAFVGPAGRILDKALHDAGIERADAYVTNAVKHFKWTPAPRGKRRLHAKPTIGEVRACRPWLEREIALIRPSVIVLLGATAGQSLLGSSFRVGASRGKPITGTQWAPVLIATIHPSAVLRAKAHGGGDEAFEALVSDLKLARASLDASDRPAPDRPVPRRKPAPRPSPGRDAQASKPPAKARKGRDKMTPARHGRTLGTTKGR